MLIGRSHRGNPIFAIALIRRKRREPKKMLCEIIDFLCEVVGTGGGQAGSGKDTERV